MSHIQHIRRSVVVPAMKIEDPAVLEIYNSYSDVAQQVNTINNAIQQFGVPCGPGLTTLAVVYENNEGHDVVDQRGILDYYVGVQFEFNNGGYWITNKTRTGCTVNWVTASAGNTHIWLWIVD